MHTVKGWYCRYSRNCSVMAHLRAKNSSLDEWYLGSPPSILGWRRPPGGTAHHPTPEGVRHPVLLWKRQFPARMVSGNLRRQVQGPSCISSSIPHMLSRHPEEVLLPRPSTCWLLLPDHSGVWLS